jgi:hypothetical protein
MGFVVDFWTILDRDKTILCWCSIVEYVIMILLTVNPVTKKEERRINNARVSHRLMMGGCGFRVLVGVMSFNLQKHGMREHGMLFSC